MGIEIDLVIYAVSVVLLGIYSGAIVALEVRSLSTGDRSADDEEAGGYVDRLLEHAVENGIALGIMRAFVLVITVIASVRLSYLYLFSTSGYTLLFSSVFSALSLLVPVFAAKVLAVSDAERFASGTRAFTYPAVWLARPAALIARGVFRKVAPGLLKLLTFQFIPLKRKIEIFGAQNGGQPDEERKLMSSVLDFGETRVREVMVPRIDIVAVNLAMDKREAIEVIMEAGHSRVPVYEDTIDKIHGTIYTKDLLRRIIDDEDFSLADIAREAFFVPESKMIDELLAEFRARRQHLAIVVDEYGGTAGIVTLEDVLEEIVGDIQDEFDTEEALLERIDEDTAVCNAKIHLDDLSEQLGMRFPEGAPDSLGGLLYQLSGSVPRVGDKHVLNGIEFEIQSVERQRIDKIIVRGLSSVVDGADDAAG
jgi:CBS domain containing-hemolysin-like protein